MDYGQNHNDQNVGDEIIIVAIALTVIWLWLFIRGSRHASLPAASFVKQILLSKLQAKAFQQAALGKEELSHKAEGKRRTKRKKAMKPPSPLLYAPGYMLFHDVKLEQRAPMLLHMLHSSLLQQHRYQWSFEATIFMLNEAIGQALLVLVVGGWLAYLANEWGIALIAAVVAIVIVLQLYQGVKKALSQRKRAMLIELPKLLTQLTLLIGAGDSVQQGFLKCIRSKQDSKHPLYVEWQEAVYELNNGSSFTVVVEKLNRNCALQQMSMLTTILLLNYRKGGEHFISAVQELNLSLWEARKTTARMKGEEASSKMIFPLVGILMLLMVLVVAPAILMMQIM